VAFTARSTVVARRLRDAAPVSLDKTGGTDDSALTDRWLPILVHMKLDFGQHDEAERKLDDASPRVAAIA
jgi:hypothetical protein